MKNIIQAIAYYITYAFWRILSILPSRILYFISDFIYLIIYYIIGYRKKVVRKNLVTSFPERSIDEIKQLEKKFYKRLSDYFMETIKLLNMPAEKIKKRIKFENTEEINKLVSEGRSVTVYMSHSFNWEYVTSLPLHLIEEAHCGQIYHPLENEYFNKLFQKIRGQYGSENITMRNTLRRIIKFQRENQKFVIGFIADQVPTWESIHHWVDFLNHDTPVFTGTEKIARRTNSAVYYLDVKRIRRGHYSAKFDLITLNPNELPEFEITNIYFKKVEKSINEQPENWLWSHNRWKRTREGFLKREARREEERKRLAGNEENK